MYVWWSLENKYKIQIQMGHEVNFSSSTSPLSLKEQNKLCCMKSLNTRLDPSAKHKLSQSGCWVSQPFLIEDKRSLIPTLAAFI